MQYTCNRLTQLQKYNLTELRVPDIGPNQDALWDVCIQFYSVTLVSPGEIHLNCDLSSPSGCVLCVRTRLTLLGMIRVISCLPVHKGLGFRMAGCGMWPSQLGSHISKFIMSP